MVTSSSRCKGRHSHLMQTEHEHDYSYTHLSLNYQPKVNNDHILLYKCVQPRACWSSSTNMSLTRICLILVCSTSDYDDMTSCYVSLVEYLIFWYWFSLSMLGSGRSFGLQKQRLWQKAFPLKIRSLYNYNRNAIPISYVYTMINLVSYRPNCFISFFSDDLQTKISHVPSNYWWFNLLW